MKYYIVNDNGAELDGKAYDTAAEAHLYATIYVERMLRNYGQLVCPTIICK